MQLKIEKEDANKILRYLQTRPWIEVFQIIPPLLRLEPVSAQEPDEKSKPDDSPDGKPGPQESTDKTSVPKKQT